MCRGRKKSTQLFLANWKTFRTKYVTSLPNRSPFDEKFSNFENKPQTYRDLKRDSVEMRLALKIRSLISKAAGGKDKFVDFVKFLFPESSSSENYQQTCTDILHTIDRDRWALSSGETSKLKNDVILQFHENLGKSYIRKNSNIHHETIDNISSSKRPFIRKKLKKCRKRIRSDSQEPPETTTPKKRGKPTFQIDDEHFIEHLILNSEPSDSTKPEGDRNFIMPIDSVVVTYSRCGQPGYSRSNLKKIIKSYKRFKKMKLYTGRCPYDKLHANLGKRLNILSHNHFNFPQHHPHTSAWPCDEEIKSHVEETKQNLFFQLLDKYKRLTPHLKLRNILKSFQRSRQKDSCWPLDTLGVTTDFMAPLPIGRSQNQTSDQDHNMTNMAVFGVVLTFRDPGMTNPNMCTLT